MSTRHVYRLYALKYLRVELYIATLHFQLMEVVDWNEIEARGRRAKAFLIFLEPETRWSGRLFLIIDRISAAAANVLIRYMAIRLLRNTREFGECRT